MIDVGKLKVVELREELSKRGLDTKGLKAELAARLEEALKEAAVSEGSGSRIVESESPKADSLESSEVLEPLTADVSGPSAERVINAQVAPSDDREKDDAALVQRGPSELDASLSTKPISAEGPMEEVTLCDASAVPAEPSLTSLDHHFRKTTTEPAIYYLPKAASNP